MTCSRSLPRTWRSVALVLAAAVLCPLGAVAQDSAAPFLVQRAGSGPPMILIPGMTSSGDVWESTVEHYRDRYELHVLTLAGFAGAPPLEDGPFLPVIRDAVIEYIRGHELDAPVLVGHSLGGFLAFWIAAEAPDVAGPVIAVDGVPYLVALNDPTASAVSMAGQAEQMRGFYATLTPEQMEAQARMAASGMVTDSSHVDTIAEWGRTSAPRTAGRAFAEMLTTDLRDAVASIRSPVLLFMAGGAFPDSAVDAAATRYRTQVERVPTAEVAVARQARHFIMLDDPDFFLSTLDRFLEAHR